MLPNKRTKLTSSDICSTNLPMDLCPLLEINTDCIVLIMEQLLPNDLSAFACCNQRLRTIARDEIALRKPSFKTLNIFELCVRSLVRPSDQVLHYMMAFGDLLTEIVFQHNTDRSIWGANPGKVAVENQLVLGHILHYCRESLSTLKMIDIQLPRLAKQKRDSRRFLVRPVPPAALADIVIHCQCVDDSIVDFIIQFEGLVYLKILVTDGLFNKLTNPVCCRDLQKIKKLKSLSLIAVCSDTVNDILANIGSFRTLEQLEIENCSWDDCTVEAFRRFRRVRDLSLNSIIFKDTSDLCSAFDRSTGVVELSLSYCYFFKDKHLIGMVDRMEALQVLKLGKAFGITESMYLQLVAIFEERGRQLLIECSKFVLNVDDLVLENHRQFVDFKLVQV